MTSRLHASTPPIPTHGHILLHACTPTRWTCYFVTLASRQAFSIHFGFEVVLRIEKKKCIQKSPYLDVSTPPFPQVGIHICTPTSLRAYKPRYLNISIPRRLHVFMPTHGHTRFNANIPARLHTSMSPRTTHQRALHTHTRVHTPIHAYMR